LRELPVLTVLQEQQEQTELLEQLVLQALTVQPAPLVLLG
jgi:hypothetical protein